MTKINATAASLSSKNFNVNMPNPPPLDNDAMQERLLMHKGSLTRCVSRYREFAEQVLVPPLTEKCMDFSSIDSTADDLIRDLKRHDIEMRKLTLSANAANDQLIFYSSTTESTLSSISKINGEINKLKLSLSHEKMVKKNREEYEALAKMASPFPARRETEEKLKLIQVEMDDVSRREESAIKELEVREKQFQLFVQSLFDLKSSLSNSVYSSKEINEKKSQDSSDRENSNNASDEEMEC